MNFKYIIKVAEIFNYFLKIDLIYARVRCYTQINVRYQVPICYILMVLMGDCVSQGVKGNL